MFNKINTDLAGSSEVIKKELEYIRSSSDTEAKKIFGESVSPAVESVPPQSGLECCRLLLRHRVKVY